MGLAVVAKTESAPGVVVADGVTTVPPSPTVIGIDSPAFKVSFVPPGNEVL
jgi:hypothetical protein